MSTALLTVIGNMNNLGILSAFGVSVFINTFTFTEFINLLLMPFYTITFGNVISVPCNRIRLVVSTKNLTHFFNLINNFFSHESGLFVHTVYDSTVSGVLGIIATSSTTGTSLYFRKVTLCHYFIIRSITKCCCCVINLFCPIQ